MWKVLLICLATLGLLFGAKLVLLQVVAPLDSSLDKEEDAGAGDRFENEPGPQAANLTQLQAGLRAQRNWRDADALELFQTCVSVGGNAATGTLAAKYAYIEKDRYSCMAALAEMHLAGVGVARNMSHAMLLLHDAAEAGDPDAQYDLALLHANAVPGSGDEAQTNEALAVLRLYAASTAGHPGALMAMGYRHMHGYGVPKSCSAAALNYIDVAKRVANVYSSGMPQAVELVRLNLHQKDRRAVSSSEMNLFTQIATSGDTTVAAAIGKRYLLGIEGFRQDYRKARYYLRMAANQHHAGALALLGYMYCLGLGVPKDLDKAYSYFVSSASQNDPLGHNGLGYIYFHGTSAQARNLKMAFKSFNESAFGGSSDGMFNLASMFLTGTGTQQSFQHAVLFYTQALDRGHTPAAYSLAVMHLNGIGVLRDCDIAVNLLKKVCERGEWVSTKLVDAYEQGDKQPDKAALHFTKLAEAGHEVAQMNAAYLYDTGSTSLLLPDDESSWAVEHELPNRGGLGLPGEARQHGRILAQRFYELSAAQGSASSELRLGDYAYYGWGVAAEVTFDEVNASVESSGEDFMPQDEEAGLVLKGQPVDYEASVARYRRAAEMTVTGEWMQSFVARGFFNLGFMHQFGLGVAQDLNLAKQHYHRCREVDPTGLHTQITFVLLFLGLHMSILRAPPMEVVMDRLLNEVRVHVLVIHVIAFVALIVLRQGFVSRRPTGTGPSPPAPAAVAQAGAQPAAAGDTGAAGSAAASLRTGG
eukprot:TRINITY_DN4018_c0_g2_i1.p1 TRINITY_DN4018_c0_g2~~TRINITY_DN4018_c0_g2_i1.p1  ORF type:complete len:758 (-),score=174.75 TRINITY_DN4018_c0_g2_i1:89-2362(-)